LDGEKVDFWNERKLWHSFLEENVWLYPENEVYQNKKDQIFFGETYDF